MQLKALTQRVYYTEHDSTTDRPCLGYVKGDKFSLMLDAGNSAAHVECFYDAVKQKGFPLPAFCGVTHFHWDHTFGMMATGIPCIACMHTQQKLEEMEQWGWQESDMQKRLQTGEETPFCDTHIRLEYPDRTKINVKTADMVFENRLSLYLGGVWAEFFRVISPHTNDSVVILVDGVLFLGDSYCSVPVGDDWVYDKSLLRLYIQVLKNIEFTHCIKGHHPPQTKAALLAELEAEL